jgi:hypothetical protein
VSCSVAVPAGLAAQHSNLKASELRADMRKLWEDHITWTRLYIVDATGNLPEKDATLQRLLKNQTDLGNAIKPFYGDAAGEKLTGLLKTHITVAGEIIDAAMKGDEAKKDDAAKRWTANADELAVFLSGANPTNWPVEDLKHMLHSHLDLTTQEVTAHLQKKWEDDIEAYDKIHVQILQMADALAMGIAKQFPQKVAY